MLSKILLAGLVVSTVACTPLRGTGDLGVVIEREPAAVQIINTTDKTSLKRITGLGDLSHASVVYSRDARYAYIFGRDGGLTKIDLLQDKIVKRILQAGNSIGGAISQDGKIIAVSNYQPAGVKLFSSETLDLIADIPAIDRHNKPSKVMGLVDAPNQKFIFSLFDGGEIWIADVKDPTQPKLKKFTDVGKQPYDALLSPDGRYYIAGLFGERGLALLDLWYPEQGVKRILPNYGKHDEKLPVYKMPHLEGWAMAGDLMFVPAVGQHEVLAINRHTWQLVKRIPVFGQPVFVMARPDGRQIWVNFAFPNNSQLQVIDVKNLALIRSFHAGKAILHMEFTPRGEHVWVSARDDNQVIIYDTESTKEIKRLPAKKPSGIFFSSRAHKMGL